MDGPVTAIPRRRLLAWLLLSSPAAVPAARAQALPDLGGRQVLAVTENAFPPLNMRDPATGRGVGWEYDAFNEVARRLNLKVEWRISSWDVMIQSVRDGQFDVGMDGIAINDERKSQVDFSAPYMRARMFMLVRAREARFADPASFRADRRLLAGAQSGTTSFYATAKELLGAKGSHPRIKLFETLGASVQALRAGDVDVVLSDLTGSNALMKQYPGVFKTVGPALPAEDYGFIFKKGSPLVAPVNAALASMAKDGTIERLNRKWLTDAPVAAR